MQDLEAACKAIRENAEANCEVCLYEKRHPDSRRTGMPPHTCHATIEAAADGMLTAVREALAPIHPNSKHSDRYAYVEATINRLREEAK